MDIEFKLLEVEDTQNKNIFNYYVKTSGKAKKETKKFYCDLIFGADAVEIYNQREFKIKLISKENFKEAQEKLQFALENIDKISSLLAHTSFFSVYSDICKYGKTFDALYSKYVPAGANEQVQKQEPAKKKYDSQKRAEKNYKSKFEEFKLRLTKEQKETLKRKAEKHKMSINSYLIWLMDNDVW